METIRNITLGKDGFEKAEISLTELEKHEAVAEDLQWGARTCNFKTAPDQPVSKALFLFVKPALGPQGIIDEESEGYGAACVVLRNPEGALFVAAMRGDNHENARALPPKKILETAAAFCFRPAVDKTIRSL